MDNQQIKVWQIFRDDMMGYVTDDVEYFRCEFEATNEDYIDEGLENLLIDVDWAINILKNMQDGDVAVFKDMKFKCFMMDKDEYEHNSEEFMGW
jgi:hypothetical protein